MRTNRVETLLSTSYQKLERVKASFNLEKPSFEKFQELCKVRGISQGDMLDALIGDLLDKASPSPGEKKTKGGILRA